MSVMQSGVLAALANGDAEVAMEPGCWTAVHSPNSATQATITKAAATDGSRHICRGISISIAAGSTAQTPIRATLIDGTTGGAKVLWSKTLSCPANQTASIDLTPLSLVGSPNTAMTLEFSGAGVTASVEDVTLIGLTLKN